MYCSTCERGFETAQLKACSRCLVPFYCSKDCQKESWEDGHRRQCKGLEATSIEGKRLAEILPPATRPSVVPWRIGVSTINDVPDCPYTCNFFGVGRARPADFKVHVICPVAERGHTLPPATDRIIYYKYPAQTHVMWNMCRDGDVLLMTRGSYDAEDLFPEDVLQKFEALEVYGVGAPREEIIIANDGEEDLAGELDWFLELPFSKVGSCFVFANMTIRDQLSGFEGMFRLRNCVFGQFWMCSFGRDWTVSLILDNMDLHCNDSGIVACNGATVVLSRSRMQGSSGAAIEAHEGAVVKCIDSEILSNCRGSFDKIVLRGERGAIDVGFGAKMLLLRNHVHDNFGHAVMCTRNLTSKRKEQEYSIPLHIFLQGEDRNFRTLLRWNGKRSYITADDLRQRQQVIGDVKKKAESLNNHVNLEMNDPDTLPALIMSDNYIHDNDECSKICPSNRNRWACLLHPRGSPMFLRIARNNYMLDHGGQKPPKSWVPPEDTDLSR